MTGGTADISESNVFDILDAAIAASGARIVFWTCPTPAHRGVTWDHGHRPPIATCTACGRTNQPDTQHENSDC